MTEGFLSCKAGLTQPVWLPELERIDLLWLYRPVEARRMGYQPLNSIDWIS